MTPPTIEVVEVQAGAGEAVTAGGRYPLGALTFVRSANGRGLVSLRAGSGKLDLAGGDAEDLGGGRWRLRIDRMALLRPEATTGICELRMAQHPPAYVALDCRVGPAGDRIDVRWRGDGSPAQRLR